MATITITPGNSFTATETVTSTKLNDLGSPTAALTAASIGTADIADDAITPALIAANTTTTVIFDANLGVFTGTVSAQVTPIDDSQTDMNQPLKVGSLSNTQLVIRATSSWTGNAYWQVIGY